MGQKVSQHTKGEERTPVVVQPESMAYSGASVRYSIPAQDNRQRWRKNSMSTSLPCRTSTTMSREDSELVTRSLHRSQQLSRQKHKQKRILKLLRKCTTGTEAVLSASYVESMRACDLGISDTMSRLVSRDDNLILLDDKQNDKQSKAAESHPARAGVDSFSLANYNKNYSEILLRSEDDSDLISHGHRGHRTTYDLTVCSDSFDHRKLFVTPRLALTSAYSSSYVDDSSEDESSLHDDPYHRSVVVNGQSTAFLADHEDTNHMSFYYDNEFDDGSADSPLGGPLHDSDLEAAICNEYASLLDRAGDRLDSLAVAQSNLSSDFENIFPTSLSVVSDDNGCISEEGSLDLSVPNYSHMAAATKHDYQITFAGNASLYSDTKSIISEGESPSDGVVDRNHHKPNQVPKPPRLRRTGNKRVSFSNELLNVDDDEANMADASDSADSADSTTWLDMKRNYTTWGQVKVKREEPKKSKSIQDMPTTVEMRKKKEEMEVSPGDDKKRYSLTLWEMYKRAHSMSLSASTSELKTPQAFLEERQSADLRNSIDALLNDVLDPKAKRPKSSTALKPLPDLAFLRESKSKIDQSSWWPEIFEQPTFCSRPPPSESSCSLCERRPSSDHTVIVFQGNGAEEQKLCQLSFLNQMFTSPATRSQCTCTREKLSDMSSSGIATGSSNVTPRDPNSWQHIADFLKKRQRNSTEVNSRGSLNSTLSDQQLLDIVGCIEAADMLSKCHSQSQSSNQVPVQETIMRVWKLVSALECVLCLGLKSHKLASVPMGRIRTRVTIWDVVEDSCKSAGEVNSSFQKILAQISTHQVEDISVRFCLFVVGLLNAQILDFWMQVLQHNGSLMDKYYQEESFLRSTNVGDRKVQSEILQCLHQLSFHTWDVDYRQVIVACTTPLDKVRKPDVVERPPIRKSQTTPQFQRHAPGFQPTKVTLM